MKTLEAALSMPIIASFVAGANIVAESGANMASSENSVSAELASSPVLAIAVIATLIASGVYFLAREIRQEAVDEQDRRAL